MSSPVADPAQGSARGGDANGGPAQANCEDAGAVAAGDGAGEAQKEARPNIGFSAKRCAVAAWRCPPRVRRIAPARVCSLLAPRRSAPRTSLTACGARQSDQKAAGGAQRKGQKQQAQVGRRIFCARSAGARAARGPPGHACLQRRAAGVSRRTLR